MLIIFSDMIVSVLRWSLIIEINQWSMISALFGTKKLIPSLYQNKTYIVLFSNQGVSIDTIDIVLYVQLIAHH